MKHNESPFQSPQAPQSETPVRPYWLREMPLVRLLVLAVIWHVASFGFWTILFASSDLLIGTTTQPSIWQTPVFFFVLVAFFVLALLSWVLGIVSVVLITRKWHHWPAVTILALLTAIPGVMLIVAAYVLVRSKREWNKANAAQRFAGTPKDQPGWMFFVEHTSPRLAPNPLPKGARGQEWLGPAVYISGMTDDASPFQSPLPEVAADRPRLLEQPYVWLLIVAMVCHIVTYALICFASTLAEQLLIDVGPDPAAWIDPTFQVLSRVLLVVVPTTFLVGFAAVFLLWQQWDNWRGAAIVALLALIPVFTLVVFGYVLLRARHELVVRPIPGEAQCSCVMKRVPGSPPHPNPLPAGERGQDTKKALDDSSRGLSL